MEQTSHERVKVNEDDAICADSKVVQMSGMSLYKRITENGTLSEPNGVPEPIYALPATVNWMRGLAILVEHSGVSVDAAKAFYANVSRRNANVHEENSIFEQLLFALHQRSALHALCTIPCKADIARVGIVTWYYGIYAAASAMVTAQDGSFQDDHTKTAGVWSRQIARRDLIMPPFNAYLSTLTKKNADKELKELSTVPLFKLAGASPPRTPNEAQGACHAYLSGSASWWRKKIENNVRSSSEFRSLGVSNFRTKEAHKLRDKRLTNCSICFLHQAFRYRGKANYREALFLGYNPSVETTLSNYVDDLSKVLDAFVTAAGIFCSQRLGNAVWGDFTRDIESKRSFSASLTSVWG